MTGSRTSKILKPLDRGNSPKVQWLGLCALTAKGPRFNPSWETKILQAVRQGLKTESLLIEKPERNYILEDAVKLRGNKVCSCSTTRPPPLCCCCETARRLRAPQGGSAEPQGSLWGLAGFTAKDRNGPTYDTGVTPPDNGNHAVL